MMRSGKTIKQFFIEKMTMKRPIASTKPSDQPIASTKIWESRVKNTVQITCELHNWTDKCFSCGLGCCYWCGILPGRRQDECIGFDQCCSDICRKQAAAAAAEAEAVFIVESGVSQEPVVVINDDDECGKAAAGALDVVTSITSGVDAMVVTDNSAADIMATDNAAGVCPSRGPASPIPSHSSPIPRLVDSVSGAAGGSSGDDVGMGSDSDIGQGLPYFSDFVEWTSPESVTGLSETIAMLESLTVGAEASYQHLQGLKTDLDDYRDQVYTRSLMMVGREESIALYLKKSHADAKRNRGKAMENFYGAMKNRKEADRLAVLADSLRHREDAIRVREDAIRAQEESFRVQEAAYNLRIESLRREMGSITTQIETLVDQRENFETQVGLYHLAHIEKISDSFEPDPFFKAPQLQSNPQQTDPAAAAAASDGVSSSVDDTIIGLCDSI